MKLLENHLHTRLGQLPHEAMIHDHFLAPFRPRQTLAHQESHEDDTRLGCPRRLKAPQTALKNFDQLAIKNNRNKPLSPRTPAKSGSGLGMGVYLMHARINFPFRRYRSSPPQSNPFLGHRRPESTSLICHRNFVEFGKASKFQIV